MAKKKDTAVFKRPIPPSEARKTRYVVGIDLGTTNTALSYVDRRSGRKAREVRAFDVAQLSEPGLVEELRTLPSSIYVRGEHELSPEQVKLPWDGPTNLLVGELARRRGTVTPDRLISSAKSWLCHSGVDRKGQILPWGGPEEVAKRSPIEVEALILRHLRDAWNHAISTGEESKRLESQDVVVTIPASFDEVARELTVMACRQAGLRVLLIEEPQAALYAWIAAHEESWKETLSVGETVLVCDVGGGTTDFSLIQVTEDEDGEPSFERTAVGDHLLLGGDNMDLALARQVEAKLGKSLDTQAWQGLVQGCREAKIRLLSGDKNSIQLAITKRGSKLIGSTIKATIAADDVVRAILEGFFPLVAVDAPAEPRARSGLKEFGLPFESDPAITRHLRDFLRRHASEGGSTPTQAGLARVDRVLFNGGVFKTDALRERVLDALGEWQARPAELEGSDLDLAVARGAAYYGLVRRGRGTRIKSGAGRAYYLEIGTRGATRSALCLIPRGIEEGKIVTISDLNLVLKANRPVVFPFHTSTVREDEAADVVDLGDAEEDLGFEELAPLHTLIRLGKKRGTKTKDVPVELVARYTEIGTLEIWAAAKESEKRWRLELDTRPRADASAPGGPTETTEGSGPQNRDGLPAGGIVFDPKKVQLAQAQIQEAIQQPASHGHRSLERLGKQLEETLGSAREGWTVPVIRALFDTLLEVKAARRRSPNHEARWLNLAGFCLRPGFGATLDDFRINEVWKVHLEGMFHPKRDAVRLEWAVCFRRIAGGFTRGQQETIFSPIQPFLLGRKRGASRQILAEYWRLGASLEHLTPKKKKTLGDLMIGQLEKGKAPPRWGPWALGRLGGRIPLHGPIDRLVSAKVSGEWLERLLKCDIKGREAIFASVQLARLTDDRTRNVSDAQREKAKAYLKARKAEDHTLRPLEEVVSAEVRTQQEFYGDSVPMGLSLKR
ncbi:MAG: Hsp70 family protein [Planctomycetes bacterium]|nr:Hsp70 family protein [Planctomycetota bacterium]